MDMRIELGATVMTKDGHRAGTVAKVVWDPALNSVSDFVITTGGLLGHDVIVSRDVLERAAADRTNLVIDLTKQELESLEHFDEQAYGPPPYGFFAPVESAYAATEFLFPLAIADTDTRSTQTRHEPERHRPAIKKGMPVRDAGGRKLGVVDELRVDDMTGELRAIVVHDGTKTREIQADHLDIGDGEIHVIEEVPGHIAGRDT
jgi:sporulation protein YlmC with PRC-barrel domain